VVPVGSGGVHGCGSSESDLVPVCDLVGDLGRFAVEEDEGRDCFEGIDPPASHGFTAVSEDKVE
jgi:hypothetical protein